MSTVIEFPIVDAEGRVVFDFDPTVDDAGAVFVGCDRAFANNRSWVRVHPSRETTIGLRGNAYWDVGPEADEDHVNANRNFAIIGTEKLHADYGGGNSPVPWLPTPERPVGAVFHQGATRWPPWEPPVDGVLRWSSLANEPCLVDAAGHESRNGGLSLMAQHLGGMGVVPTIEALDCALVDSLSIEGTDAAMLVGFQALDLAGPVVRVTFNEPFESPPIVIMHPANNGAVIAYGAFRLLASDVSCAGFTIRTTGGYEAIVQYAIHVLGNGTSRMTEAWRR